MHPVREYRRLVRSAEGRIVVTITLVSGPFSIRWSEKGYSSETDKTVERAYRGAQRSLRAVRDATNWGDGS